jgi:hypothetical protein
MPTRGWPVVGRKGSSVGCFRRRRSDEQAGAACEVGIRHKPPRPATTRPCPEGLPLSVALRAQIYDKYCVRRGHTIPQFWGGAESLLAHGNRSGHHLHCCTTIFDEKGLGGACLSGGERWVAETRSQGYGRAGHFVVEREWTAPGRRCNAVVVTARGGRGRGSGISANGSVSASSGRSPPLRRIHSASTIASASPMTATTSLMVLITHPLRAADPASPCCQALIGFFSPLWLISMRRGLAFSATGILSWSTPS